MFLSHFATAFSAKRIGRDISLGTLILAAQFLDILWPIFLLLGLEHVEIRPGITVASSLDYTFYPYSHSLAAALLWSVLLGSGYYFLRRSWTSASVIGGLVFTHWTLDLLVHRPDLPLAFIDGPYFGLGGWNSFPLTICLEVGLFAVGVLIYTRATRAKDRTSRYVVWILATILVVVWLGSTFGPPAPDEHTIGLSGSFIWLPIILGYWTDRHRKINP